ncbi:hypothetical protein TEU_07490 [Thermococcus eurythermalis]|uniref:Uncharacterized protein n=1 Tax=Thermococcus eurythermalis TaxID=1505907 RepID=A0A097QUN1_9EURY|nr:hypothetical protein [Thermococcus eurythermalis]AIU70186.1 hypothetical protein TEU_07490 [Thermococcus eurythermalis]
MMRIEVDGYGSIEITQEAIRKLFEDEQILKKLIELDIAEKERILARMREFVREYPPELIEKLRVAEELDEEIYELEEEIAVLNEILKALRENREAEQ